MGLFKKSIRYSKSSNDLEYKIKNLDEDLKKTKVTIDQSDKDFFCEQKNSDLQSLDDQKYDWRKSLENSDIKSQEQLLEEDISEIRESLDKKNNSLRRVEPHIESLNEDFTRLRKEIFEDISEKFLFNIPSIEQKVDKVLKIYDQVQEGLLNEPPSTRNSDPLTPLNKNFVTADDLNKHYSLFINRIQEQLATIGGGGEYRLKYLDDIVGIATNASNYDGKFLSYNHNLGKFEFVGAATTSQTGIGISIGDTPPIDTTRYPLWFDNQTGRSYIYYTDEDGSQWVDLSPSTTSGNKISYWIQTGVGIHTLSNVGIGTTNPSTKLEVQNGDIKVGVNTSSGVILTSPNGSQYRLIVDNSGNLSTVFVS